MDTIVVHSGRPARSGQGPLTFMLALARHDANIVPCYAGPRAAPTAKAWARNAFSVPGWPVKHSRLRTTTRHGGPRTAAPATGPLAAATVAARSQPPAPPSDLHTAAPTPH